jgi:Flp pilus assembly CpaE family ATPase
VVVTGSSLRAVRATVRLIDDVPVVRDHRSRALLVVDPGRPYRASEIASGCGIERVVELPRDPRAAVVWSDGAPAGRHLERTPLQRAARRVADTLAVRPAEVPE